MGTVSDHRTPARARAVWHALRPALVLSGFVAVWWALMTGVANADTPQHRVPGLERLGHSATPQARNTHDVVVRVRQHVREHAGAAAGQTRPVTDLVEATPVTRQATRTVHTTVRTTVRDAVATTRDLVRESAAKPVVDEIHRTVRGVAEKAESSTGQGNSRPRHHVRSAAATSFAMPVSTVPATGFVDDDVPTAERTAPAGTPPPTDAPAGAPTLPDPCASPSGSGSTSFAPAGIAESSRLGDPAVLRDHRTWRLARLPGGPAYQPGTSPD